MKKQDDLPNKIANVFQKGVLSLQLLESEAVPSVEEAIGLLQKLKGRLVVTGMGKSAIVSQKIVATMNSTGTPSIYMHAGDALHGDLGMITEKDALLIVSKSGSRGEYHNILARAEYLTIPILSIVGNKMSYVANKSRVAMLIPTMECDTLGMAPTSSVLAQIAIGDALAVGLQHLNEWSHEKFAEIHPGGTLGKKLLFKIKDFNPSRKAPRVENSTPIRDVIHTMSSGRMGAVAVCKGDAVEGIITDGDLRRALEKTLDLSALTANDISISSPKTCTEDMKAREALCLMEDHNISQLIVIDNDMRYVGMIHIHDILSEEI